jgi:hypothetical protein
MGRSMLIAQALGEYGAMGALLGAIRTGMDGLVDTAGSLDASTWAMIGFGVFVVWFVVGKFR